MSLKETLGLRTYREDPRMFWFEMALLCFLVGLVCALLNLFRFQGVPGLVIRLAVGVGICWGILCAVQTEAASRRKQKEPPSAQVQLEDRLLLMTALLALLERLLLLFPSETRSYLVVAAGLCLYFIVRISGPKLRRRETFSSGEIIKILLLGMIAFGLFVPFLNMVAEIVSSL